MNKIDYTQALQAVEDMLQGLVADYLDVNRKHIQILFIDVPLCGEDGYDWDMNPEDAMEGTEWEEYRMFTYQFREDTRTLDYGEPVDMIWRHIDERNFDSVMTEEEFDTLIENRKTDKCSMVWYEGEDGQENEISAAPMAISTNGFVS